MREPGVALLEEEPPPLLRKRLMPSEGMLGSVCDCEIECGLWVPVGVAVAETDDIWGAKLCEEWRWRRRLVRASASGKWCAVCELCSRWLESLFEVREGLSGGEWGGSCDVLVYGRSAAPSTVGGVLGSD